MICNCVLLGFFVGQPQLGCLLHMCHTDMKTGEQLPLFRFFVITSNLLLPGMGLVALGYRRLAWTLQACLLLSVSVFCWTGYIFEPDGVVLFLSIIALIYLLSCVACLLLDLQPRAKLFLPSMVFVLFSLSIFTTGFVYKHYLLGVHIFFVPSASMYPSLKPGQFILIDSWAYHDKPPAPGDVVVFRHVDSDKTLVKRIANWPDGKLLQSNLWYLLGDNANHSRDSRMFGGVKLENIIGQVKMVLIAIDQDNDLVIQDGLTKIKQKL